MNTSAMDRLTPQNSAVLFIDHQTGLCNGVTTQNPTEFKSNVIGLAKLARIFKLPAVITTSAENGPNGPFLPEVRARSTPGITRTLSLQSRRPDARSSSSPAFPRKCASPL